MRPNAEPSVFCVDRRESAGLFGERAQAVLRQLHFRQQPLLRVERPERTARPRRARPTPRRLDVLARHADQPARIEREEVHVRACRGGDGVLDGAHDVGGGVNAVDLAHRHLEAFAEQQHGLAAAADARQELAEIPQRVEHRQRPLLALEIANIDRGARNR